MTVGDGVGLNVGFLVGSFVGGAVGLAVGHFVGVKVGLKVGSSVGVAVTTLHLVYAKQDSPSLHSSALPEVQGVVHFSLASSLAYKHSPHHQ